MKTYFSVFSTAVTVLSISLTSTAQTPFTDVCTDARMRVEKQSSSSSTTTATSSLRGSDNKTDENIKFGFGARQLPQFPSKIKALKQRDAAGAAGRRASSTDVSLPSLIGSVIYSSTWTSASAPTGVYTIPANADQSFNMLINGPTARGGGVLKDGVYYSTDYVDMMGAKIVSIRGYELATRKKVFAVDGNDFQLVAADMTYDATTDRIYGLFYNADLTGLNLAYITYGTDASGKQTAKTTVIGAVEGSWNSIAAAPDGTLYGIKMTLKPVEGGYALIGSTLEKIDKTTAACTTIGSTGHVPYYFSSSTIDPVSGRMFWTVMPSDEPGYLAEVNLQTGVATELYAFPGGEEVVGLAVNGQLSSASAPAAVTDLSASFSGSSLAGTVSFTMPATLVSGAACTGTLPYRVLANGTQVAEGTAQSGAAVTANVTVPASGDYSFVVTTSNEGGMSPKAETAQYVGYASPGATAHVTAEYANGNFTINWEAVTRAVTRGFFEASNVTYTITRLVDGEAQTVATGVTGTSYTDPVAEPSKATTYVYTVTAVNGDAAGQAVQSGAVVLGAAKLPFAETFDNSAAMDKFTIIDANGDGKKWNYYVMNKCARMQYNSTLEMDDWLITPPFYMEAGKVYTISFTTYGSTKWNEALEVTAGMAATPEGQTATIMVLPNINWSSKDVFTVDFAPETSGIHFVGFHGISPPGQLNLYLDNIQVSTGALATTPGAAADLTVTPDPLGAYKATVEFTVPTVDKAGKPVSGVTKVEVLRNNATVIKTFEGVAPGQKLSYTDEIADMTAGAVVSYQVIGYNADGQGATATAKAYLGINVPAAPTNVKARETQNLGEVTLTWDPVTLDKDGNALSQQLLSYRLYQYLEESGWTPVNDVVIPASQTSYTYQAVPADAEQTTFYYGVAAITQAVVEKDLKKVIGEYPEIVLAGKPYTTYAESFANGDQSTVFFVDDYEGSGVNLGFLTDNFGIAAQDGDNGYFAMSGATEDTYIQLKTGKIFVDPKLKNPAFSFYTYCVGGFNPDGSAKVPDLNELAVSVRDYTTEDWTQILNRPISKIADAEPGYDGWIRVTVPLSAYAGKTVQFCLKGTIKNYRYIFLDNMQVGSLAAVDVAAGRLNAPSVAVNGTNYLVRAEVINHGVNPTGAFKVNLYADGELADSRECEGIAPEKFVILNFQRRMHALATEPVAYRAEVVLAGDENTANNSSAEQSVRPKASAYPAVSNVQATVTGAGVSLSWDAPKLDGDAAAEKTESFETGTSFAKEFEGWTFVDQDNTILGTLDGVTLPGIQAGTSRMAYMVMDATHQGLDSTFAAHTGSKCLVNMFNDIKGRIDDWAISPELSGAEQTITFWARSYNADRPERMEVHYSTGSLSPSDFISVQSATSVPGTWTEYKVTVPEGARYFAVRTNTMGGYFIMLDDFTFSPMNPAKGLVLQGYNVYHNAKSANETVVAERNFTHAVNAQGLQRYIVTAVYDKGESQPSDAVEVDLAGVTDGIAETVTVQGLIGAVAVNNADGLPVAVTAIDGRLIHKAVCAGNSCRITLANGLYVVTVNGTSYKVLVK